jgi:hypothetical protein
VTCVCVFGLHRVTLSTGNVITVGEGSCPAIAQSSGCDGEERAGECEALFCGLGGWGGESGRY